MIASLAIVRDLLKLQDVNVYGVEASMVMQWTVNPPPSGTPGSIPGYSTKYGLLVLAEKHGVGHCPSQALV